MRWPENAESAAASQTKDEGSGSASVKLGADSDVKLAAELSAEPNAELERKARIAFGLYLILTVVAWFTMDGTVLVYGRPVELRLVPLIVLVGLAAKTLLALKAEKIRRASSQDRGNEGFEG
jgi:hypothetical protein